MSMSQICHFQIIACIKNNLFILVSISPECLKGFKEIRSECWATEALVLQMSNSRRPLSGREAGLCRR